MGRQWRGSCGKILKESMPLLPGLLEAGRELDDELRYSPAVRSELEAMGATGHRSLTCLGASHRPVAGQVDDRGRSVGFRSSIQIRKAGPQRGGKPEAVNMTDVLMGWTFVRSIRRRRRQDSSSSP